MLPNNYMWFGNEKLLNNFSIAMIGSRNAEDESKKIAEKISYNLSKNNIQIISGMALGIDSAAHNACLKAKGKTIAVLGSGFNDIYPKENIRLFYKILEEEGVIITEYDLDMPPLKHNFIRRNRIVAALSSGVVLIQAKENSGSITTAKYALKLKRNLFVLPGAAFNLNYKGSNNLLVNGAKCILSYKDILKEYKEFSNKINLEKDKDEIKETIKIPNEYIEIYKMVSDIPKSINQISIELKIPIQILSYKLTLMEMEGFIKSLPGRTFIRCYWHILYIATKIYL